MKKTEKREQVCFRVDADQLKLIAEIEASLPGCNRGELYRHLLRVGVEKYVRDWNRSVDDWANR